MPPLTLDYKVLDELRDIIPRLEVRIVKSAWIWCMHMLYHMLIISPYVAPAYIA